MVHPAIKRPTKAPLLQRLWKARWFYLLMAPGLIYFFVCNYITMAFQEYSPSLGFLKSPWIGLKHFQQFFHDGSFEKLFGNALILSLESLIFSFPAPVMLALFLHEIRHNTCKRVVQTLMYLPHFLAAVVICSIAYQLFPTEVRTPPCDAALSLLKNFLTTRPLHFTM